MKNQANNVKAVQGKILEIMKFIDDVCRKNGIIYYIMGGTALGAIRHGGFIPWDDDLDIFMTPDQYAKFVIAMEKEKSDKYILQEWRSVPNYLEYAKVRMNGTAFIEKNFKNNKHLHQGIYVDIMILHKVPNKKIIQKKIYYMSKYVTLYGLTQRNWTPKTKMQKLAVASIRILPGKWLANKCYKNIYRYDNIDSDFCWCYWITKAGFSGGLFEEKYFSKATDIEFEDTVLMGSEYIKEYLVARYGDYMKLPPEEDRKAAVHAEIFDVERDYSEYLE